MSYFICSCCSCCLARCDRSYIKRSEFNSFEFIGKCKSCNGYISGVLYLDGVGNGVARSYSAGFGGLGYFDCCCCSLSGYCAVIIVLHFFARRICSLSSCCVVDLTCVYVCLSYLVSCCCSCRFARCKSCLVKRSELDSFKFIGKCKSGYCHVSGVLYCDRVGHGVPCCYSAGLGSLGHFDGCCCSLCRYCAVITVCYSFVLRIFTCSSCSIVDLACVYVCLSYFICGCCSRCSSGCKSCLVKYAELDSFEFIAKCQSGHCYVSGVLNGDRVGNGIAYLDIFILRGLCNFNGGFCFFSLDYASCTSGHIFATRFFTCCGYLVVDLAFVNVCLRYCVGSCCSSRLVRCKGRLVKIAKFDSSKDIFYSKISYCHVSAVGHFDRVSNSVSYLESFFLISSLGDCQSRGSSLCCYLL